MSEATSGNEREASLHPPLEGEGRREAAGWGEATQRNVSTPPRLTFRCAQCEPTLPLQGRVRKSAAIFQLHHERSEYWIARYDRERGAPYSSHAPPPSRGAMRPSCAGILRPQRGRGECRVPVAPAAARGVVVSTRVSHHGRTGITRHSRTRWFYGLFRALPGDRAFLSPSPPRSLLLKNLTPASRRQDHTTSPSAKSTTRPWCHRVHRIPTLRS
jgi:hypothetical protein